jgi:replicative DNA helicase
MEIQEYRPKHLYDDKFQQKLLKIMIEGKDETFAIQIVDTIVEEYFDRTYYKMLFRHMKSYYDTYGLIPKFETLNEVVNIQEEEGSSKQNLLDILKSLEQMTINDKGHVKDRALEFCISQAKERSMEKACKAFYEEKNPDRAFEIIEEAKKVGQPKTPGHSYVHDVEKRMIKKHRLPVPTMEGLNIKIGGGLAGGELGIVMAATGGGKSMMLVKFACEAFLANKKVMFYTLELGELHIGNRIDACLSGIELKSTHEYPDRIREVVKSHSLLGADIMIQEYPTGSASVNTIKAHLKKQEREGFIPDIIFIDYQDLMKPIFNYNEKRFALTAISEEVRGLAMEKGIPIWTASQAGRSAFGKERIGLESMAESIGKAQTADVVLGLGRTPEDKQNRSANLSILKNRNGDDDLDVQLHFDTTKLDIRVKESATGGGLGIKALSVEKTFRKDLPTNPAQ